MLSWVNPAAVTQDLARGSSDSVSDPVKARDVYSRALIAGRSYSSAMTA